MKIYSGYFGGLKKNKYPNPINIAGYAPKDWKGLSISWLAPKKEWFWDWKEKIGTKTNGALITEYLEKYLSTTLDSLSPEEIYQRLQQMTNDEDCTIMCYEKAPKVSQPNFLNLMIGVDFCHRHIVTAFLRSGGFEAEELILNNE